MKIQYLAIILLFPALIGIQMFLGRPNSLGISLFSLCLYLYICKPQNFRFQIIASTLAIVTVQVHHMSALFLVPVIIFTSLFLVKDIKSVISLIYAIPTMIILNTILNSSEFEKVNYFLSMNPSYEGVFNTFVGNKYIFLSLWIILTFISYYLRTYQKNFIKSQFEKLKEKIKQTNIIRKIDESTNQVNLKKLSYYATIGALIIVEVIGIFVYSASLSSWFISAELVLLLILSGLSLISKNTMKICLFILGFFFYGMTVVSTMLFSSEPELSWVAPRTFIFTVIFGLAR